MSEKQKISSEGNRAILARFYAASVFEKELFEKIYSLLSDILIFATFLTCFQNVNSTVKYNDANDALERLLKLAVHLCAAVTKYAMFTLTRQSTIGRCLPFARQESC